MINMELEKGKLGNAIRQKRMDAHMSQEMLAEAVGITPTHLKHLESEHRKPSIEVLVKLAYILNLSLDELVFPSSKHCPYHKELELLLSQCNESQLRVIIATARALIAEKKTHIDHTTE